MFLEDDGDISLRRLACRADVAVGTIYNYFPDKDDLIKALFQREWRRTMERVDRVMDVDAEEPSNRSAAPDENTRSHLIRVRAVVEVVYDDIERISRTGGQRRKLACSKDRETAPYPLRVDGWRWLCSAFAPVWEKLFRTDRGDRLTVALVATAHRLVALFPDDREGNIEFLVQMVMTGEI